jgi:O-methyltransferase
MGLPESYIFLLKQSLLNDLYIENEARIIYLMYALVEGKQIDIKQLENIGEQHAMRIVDQAKEVGAQIIISKSDEAGQLHPLPYLRAITDVSHTMIGRKRLNNLEHCLTRIVADRIPGDLIETGVWRGGATIFMRGFLKAHGIEDRTVWVADSFEGLPPPSRAEDAGYDLSSEHWPSLAVRLEAVQNLFSRYGLLDEKVRFLKGWFKDTLPAAPIERLAVLRLDGDLYESTMDALEALYAKVSPGGYVIVDDYFSMPPCTKAVDEFRQRCGIRDEPIVIDRDSIFWRKSA